MGDVKSISTVLLRLSSINSRIVIIGTRSRTTVLARPTSSATLVCSRTSSRLGENRLKSKIGRIRTAGSDTERLNPASNADPNSSTYPIGDAKYLRNSFLHIGTALATETETRRIAPPCFERRNFARLNRLKE